VRVTVIAAGFDRWGQREAEDLVKPEEEIFSIPAVEDESLFGESGKKERLVFDADDLDVPSFLRNE
jgi:hypothetical protein